MVKKFISINNIELENLEVFGFLINQLIRTEEHKLKSFLCKWVICVDVDIHKAAHSIYNGGIFVCVLK